MANLPDLDTSSIGIMAFWNAIDQGGVESIDPMGASSDFNSYTAYDNGIEGEVTTTTAGRPIMARIKTDGWIVVYFDERNSFETNVTGPNGGIENLGPGIWELVTKWNGNPNEAPGLDKFTTILNDLRKSLSNSGNMTYNQSDVGIFSPLYPDATNMNVFSQEVSYNSNGTASGSVKMSVNSIDYFVGVAHVGSGADAKAEVRGTGQSAITLGNNGESGSVNLKNTQFDLSQEITLWLRKEYEEGTVGFLFALWR